jgi:outer membrane protein OmpA-like peptidoglycan-associated protein
MKKTCFPFFLLLSLASVCQPIQKLIVNFDFNSSTIRPEAKARLDSLVQLIGLNNPPVQSLEITGHCDSIGSISYNQALSERRALAVSSYLTSHGVNKPFIKKVAGYSKLMPLNSNTDSLMRFQNRRVEIAIYYISGTTATTKKSIDVSKVEVNKTLVLENINFEHGTHIMLKQSYPSLQMLVNTLQENPTLKIEIQGHVCCSAPTDGDALDDLTHTYDLSLRRARVIYEYLINQGIQPERLSYIGLGPKFPLVKELTEQDRVKNRRVEIKILQK